MNPGKNLPENIPEPENTLQVKGLTDTELAHWNNSIIKRVYF